MASFAGWEDFFVIVGSSAGALIGLQFVVVALVVDVRLRQRPEGIAAFGTPNTLYFGAALLLSALATVPWPEAGAAALAFGLVGLLGVPYVLLVTRRMRNYESYTPQREDWAFFVALPLAAFVLVAASAAQLQARPGDAPFGIAAGALLLLFVGVHNAWDIVTYVAFHLAPEAAAKG